MTTVYRTFKYIDQVDPASPAGSGGVINVRIIDLPPMMHTITYISVHSLNIPIPNRVGYVVPRQLRLYCTTPTTAQGPSGYNNVLLQIYPCMHIVPVPGDFSVICYRDVTSGDSTALQILDPQFSTLRLTLTDGDGTLFQPSFPFDIILKIELVRNYEAEQLEQLAHLVKRQELALVQQDLLFRHKLEPPETTWATGEDLYGPLAVTEFNT